MTHRFRLFAGPNGSGKSTIKNDTAIKPAWLANQINPDELLAHWQETGYVDLPDAPRLFTLTEIRDAYQRTQHWGDSSSNEITFDMRPNEDRLIVNGQVDAYTMSWLSEFLRNRLIESGESFTSETVMSHISKIELLQRTRDANYRNYLYFVCTNNPAINVQRVGIRVHQGGHDVPVDKIVDRYARCLKLLPSALRLCHRAYLFDNSGESPRRVAELNPQGEVRITTKETPAWLAGLIA